MNLNLYLDKINLKVKTPSLEFLNELITAHQKTISFNNLAVFYNPGKLLDVELDPLFQKVIVRGEGGYCFENNKVFYYLLKELGFDVEAKLGRVVYDKTGDVPRTHRTTIVTLNGKKLLADVGFGKDTPPKAIALDENQTTGHQVIKDGDIYRLQFHKGDSLMNLYTFDDGHYQETDFMVANYYTNTHPNSKFTKEVILVRKEPDFIEFINGKTYTQIKNGVRTDHEIKGQAEFQSYLAKFGITQTYDYSKLPEKISE